MQSDIKSYERTLKRMNQYDNNSKDPIERVKGSIEAICLKTEIYDYENTQELLEIFDNKIKTCMKPYNKDEICAICYDDFQNFDKLEVEIYIDLF
jgi:hypothetical protein